MKPNAKVYVMVDSEGRIKLGHSVNPAARSKQIRRIIERACDSADRKARKS